MLPTLKSGLAPEFITSSYADDSSGNRGDKTGPGMIIKPDSMKHLHAPSPDYLQLWSLVSELAQGCPKGSAGNFNQSAVRRVQLHH